MPVGEEAGLRSVLFYRYSTFFFAHGLRVIAGRRLNTRAYKDFSAVCQINLCREQGANEHDCRSAKTCSHGPFAGR